MNAKEPIRNLKDKMSQLLAEEYKLQLSENIKAGIRHAKLLKANSKK